MALAQVEADARQRNWTLTRRSDNGRPDTAWPHVPAWPKMDVMAETRSSALRRFGWILIAVCLVGIGLWVVAKAAADQGRFEYWAGWANIFALPAGALGTALVIFDRMSPRTVPPAGGPPEVGNSVPSTAAQPTPEQLPSGAPSSSPNQPAVTAAPQTQNITAMWGGFAQGAQGVDSRVVNLESPHAQAPASPLPKPKAAASEHDKP